MNYSKQPSGLLGWTLHADMEMDAANLRDEAIMITPRMNGRPLGVAAVALLGMTLFPALSSGQTSCTTPQPGPDWTCDNGNWLPPGMVPQNQSSAACHTPRPASNWVCHNGNWLPPDLAADVVPSILFDLPAAPSEIEVNGVTLTLNASVNANVAGCVAIVGVECPPVWSGLVAWLRIMSESAAPIPTVVVESSWLLYDGTAWPASVFLDHFGSPTPTFLATYGSGEFVPLPATVDVVVQLRDWEGNLFLLRDSDLVMPPWPSGACTTVKPGPDWICHNGGWLPPGYPIDPQESAILLPI